MSVASQRLPVIVAAGTASWEAEALERIAASPAVALLKRCVDLPDLLATAATGAARVALVSRDLLGLDADSLAQLAAAGVDAVVVTGGAGRATAEAAQPPARLASETVLEARDVADVVDRLLLAGAARRSASEPTPSRAPATPIAPAAAETGAATGRIVTVWGPGGGPGRTTLAVGIAAELAARGGALLLDADPYGGAVAQHLALLEEVSGLLAAARLANAGQLDVARLAGLAREVGAGLRVLTGLPRPDRWAEVRPGPFADLLEVAARLEGHLVVDTGSDLDAGEGEAFALGGPSRNDMTLSAIAAADDLVVVGAADPVGLARLGRGLVQVAEVSSAGPRVVVVNRTRHTLGWREADLAALVAQVAPRAQVVFLPEDRPAADRALVSGRTLLESGDSSLRRGVAGVVDVLLGQADAGRGRRRLLQSLSRR